MTAKIITGYKDFLLCSVVLPNKEIVCALVTRIRSKTESTKYKVGNYVNEDLRVVVIAGYTVNPVNRIRWFHNWIQADKIAQAFERIEKKCYL